MRHAILQACLTLYLGFTSFLCREFNCSGGDSGGAFTSPELRKIASKQLHWEFGTHVSVVHHAGIDRHTNFMANSFNFMKLLTQISYS
jgi:hypothetical protein